MDVVDAVENLHGRAKARRRATRQVHLRDVARDNDFRAEPEPREEHLHLLGSGVLRLVEDDEGVIEGVVREQEILGDIERVLGGDADAHGFLGTRRFDSVDEPHRPTATRLVVLRHFARQPEGSNS